MVLIFVMVFIFIMLKTYFTPDKIKRPENILNTLTRDLNGPDLLVRADQLFGPWIPDSDPKQSGESGSKFILGSKIDFSISDFVVREGNCFIRFYLYNTGKNRFFSLGFSQSAFLEPG